MRCVHAETAEGVDALRLAGVVGLDGEDACGLEAGEADMDALRSIGKGGEIGAERLHAVGGGHEGAACRVDGEDGLAASGLRGRAAELERTA